jgi:peptidoglycan/LPS O-acetylase OafA/YrhL
MSAPPENDSAPPNRVTRVRAAFSLRKNLRSLVHEPAGAFTSLDGLRALAALWVLTFHAVTIPLITPTTAGKLAPYARRPLFRVVFAGHLSVDIFLVLAGFLMAHLLLRERDATGSIRYGRFVRRRWLRIVPLYAATLLLYMGDDPVQLRSCAHWGWANLFFVNNFFGPQLRPESCVGHGWSLAVEFQLYLLTPILVAVFHARRIGAWLAIAIGLVVSAAIVFWFDAHPTADWYATALYDKPWGRATPYFAGMLAAYAVASKRAHSSIATTLIAALSLVTLVALVFTPPDWVNGSSYLRFPLLLFGRSLFGGALAYLVWCMVTGRVRLLARALSWRAWLPLARLSYAAYLVQFVCVVPTCVWWAPRLLRATSYAQLVGELCAQTIVSMMLTFALALVGYLFVEKPFMNLRER